MMSSRVKAAKIQIGIIYINKRAILQAGDRSGDRVDVKEPGEQIACLAEPPVGIIQFPGAVA